MATIGQPLTTPEAGWKRYDDSSPAIVYSGTWYIYTAATGHYLSTYRATVPTGVSTGVSGGSVTFSFEGTKLRWVAFSASSTLSADVTVTIDGIDTHVDTNMSSAGGGTGQVLIYEKTGLSQGKHTVKITNNTINGLFMDAIDIDSTGRLLHPDEVTDLNDLSMGKRIRANYKSITSGSMGTFSGLGKEIKDFIPVASSATPDGDLYFICVDIERWSGRKKLIADRNVQHSISWDTLNTKGVASGSGLPINYDISLPLWSGYRFEDVSGSTVNDVTGKYNGTVVGTLSTVAGVKGNAIQLGSSRVSVNRLAIPVGKKSIRFKMKTTQTTAGFILDTTNNDPSKWGIRVVSSAGNITCTLGSGTTPNYGSIYTIASSGTIVNDGQWHDVLLTWDGTISANGVKLYVDNMNTPNAIATAKSATELAHAYDLTIGSDTVANTLPFIGALDELEIYNDVVDPVKATLEPSKFSYSTRLLTGGTVSTDKDNEWDNYVANSTLGGTVTAGDNNIWNWSSLWSWGSTVPSALATNRVSRGSSASTAWGYNVTTTATASSGFRPVLIIDNLYIDATSTLASNILIKSDYIKEPNGRYGYQLSGTITIPFRSSISSNIVVFNEEVVIDPVYPPTLGNQRKATIFIPNRNSMLSSILISPKNKMSGLVDIIQPPTYTFDNTSIKDAFLRSSIPTLNYGTEQMMVVGYNAIANDKYRSLVQFDISNIPVNAKIEKATLKLFNTKTNVGTHQVGVYTSSTEWIEDGVTWISQPAIKDIVAIANLGETGYSDVDVTNKIKDWYAGADNNHGFIVKAMNEIFSQSEQFSTRENSINKPTLEIKYKLNIIYSAGRTDLTSNLYIHEIGKSTLNSNLIINEYDSKGNLPSNIHVYNFNYWMESNILVNRRELTSNIIVVRHNESDISSSLQVRVKGGYLPQDNLQGNLFINAKDRLGRITVPHRDNLSSNVVVQYRFSDKNNLLSSITISKETMPSNVIVRRKNDSDLTSSIQVIIHNNFPSNIVVNRRDMYSNITVNHYESLASNIIVTRHESIQSEITVPSRSNIPSSMSVIYATHLPSSIYVLSGNLRSNIKIPAYAQYDKIGNLTVRVKGIGEISCTLIVGENNIVGGYIYIL
jgi:hypothetical protein